MSLTLNAIGKVVADMAATLRFYRLLGMQIPESADAEQHVEVDLGNGMRLLFDTHEVVASFDPDFTPPTGSGPTSLAVQADSPAEVDSTYAALTGAGFEGEVPPWDAVWGQRYAVVRDPDGGTVDLYAPLPTG